jgi:CAP12/Pycsar effector protein, TIR domain
VRPRTSVVGFLPSLGLAVFIIVLIWMGPFEYSPSIDRLIYDLIRLSSTMLGLLLLGVAVLSLIAHPIVSALARILESRGSKPTSLGGALHSAERQAQLHQFSLRPVSPQLYEVVGDKWAAALIEYQGKIDALARLCVVLFLMSLGLFLRLILFPWWLVVVSVPLSLAFLSWSSAAREARGYADAIRAATSGRSNRTDHIAPAHSSGDRASTGSRAAPSLGGLSPMSITQDQPTGSSDPTVFLVHGHQEQYKEAVARLIERCVLGVEVIILHEQVNQGQTVVEKFEHHAGIASYAVVLMTGDDRGSKMAEQELSPRARQNVILELGYFIGKLGRANVAVLQEEGVEMPSDIFGLVYITIDAGGRWRYELARELDAAGFPVDLKRIH